MKLRFIKNFKALQVVEANEVELQQLTNVTTGKEFNYRRKKDDVISFFHNYSIIPAGFWVVLLALNKKGYKVEIENISEFLTKTSRKELDDWVNSCDDLNFPPYKYQMDGLFIFANYRHCRVLLDTGAGKSYLIYLISRYLLEKKLAKGLKVLVIVPRTMLVTQLPKDFDEYSPAKKLICDEVMSGGVEREGSNVVVGNINSVSSKPFSWFKQFGCVILDEAHKINNSDRSKDANMIQDVMNAMLATPTCDYIFSMSGTFEDKDNGSTTYSEYKAVTETAYLGTVMQKLYMEDLKEYNSLAPVKITIVPLKLSYNLADNYFNHIDCQEEGGRFLFEKSYIQGIKQYRTIPYRIACGLKYNQVLLYSSKDFLYKMAEECQSYIDEKGLDKKVFIITGDTKKKDRQAIIDELNEHHNGILFAMYSILSTGVSVKSLCGLHLVDSTKAVTTVRQSIGRVLRLHPDVKEALVYDYPVIIPKYNPEWGGGFINSYANHAKERLHIYKKREIDVTTLKPLKVDGRSSFMDEIPRALREKKPKKP